MEGCNFISASQNIADINNNNNKAWLGSISHFCSDLSSFSQQTRARPHFLHGCFPRYISDATVWLRKHQGNDCRESTRFLGGGTDIRHLCVPQGKRKQIVSLCSTLVKLWLWCSNYVITFSQLCRT